MMSKQTCLDDQCELSGNLGFDVGRHISVDGELSNNTGSNIDISYCGSNQGLGSVNIDQRS